MWDRYFTYKNLLRARGIARNLRRVKDARGPMGTGYVLYRATIYGEWRVMGYWDGTKTASHWAQTWTF